VKLGEGGGGFQVSPLFHFSYRGNPKPSPSLPRIHTHQ
jgi:hypothetical protein